MPGGQIPLKAVWAMLDECAVGHSRKLHTHNYSIRFCGRTFPHFPKGEHGSSNPPIQRGTVRRMAKFFGILECARKHFDI